MTPERFAHYVEHEDGLQHLEIELFKAVKTFRERAEKAEAERDEAISDLGASHTACDSCRVDDGRVYAFCPCCGTEN